MSKKRLAIVGGGVAGVSLAWLASTSASVNRDWDIVLIHDEPALGGHSHSIPVKLGGQRYPIDIGVQFGSPVVYPHVFAMLRQPEMRARVPMRAMPAMPLSTAFTPEHNWTTDLERAARQRDRFADMNARTLGHAREISRDIARCLWTRHARERAAGMTLEAYFAHKPHLVRSPFFRFCLMPCCRS